MPPSPKAPIPTKNKEVKEGLIDLLTIESADLESKLEIIKAKGIEDLRAELIRLREIISKMNFDQQKKLIDNTALVNILKEMSEYVISNSVVVPPPHLQPLLSNYDTQKASLITLGLLDSKGSYILEGVTYTYPSREEVTNRLLAMDQALLEKKMEQGFTRLHITPNGLPYQKYIDTLIDLTKKKAIKRGDKYYLKDNLGNEAELNPSNPLYKWDGHDANDWTTNDISEADHTKATNGFDISLLEDDLNLPRENTNQTIGERTRLEANKTPSEYLELLKEANTDPTNPNYKVGGISRQELITLYINTLNTEGVILDNYANSKSSAAYAIASQKDSDVSMLYWAASGRQWDVVRQDVDTCDVNDSSRVSVRV